MGLGATSTRADALAQLNDNLLWEGSPAKAGLFIEAVRWLLANTPQSSSTVAGSMTANDLREELARAERYYASASDQVQRASFVRARMRTL